MIEQSACCYMNGERNNAFIIEVTEHAGTLAAVTYTSTLCHQVIIARTFSTGNWAESEVE